MGQGFRPCSRRSSQGRGPCLPPVPCSAARSTAKAVGDQADPGVGGRDGGGMEDLCRRGWGLGGKHRAPCSTSLRRTRLVGSRSSPGSAPKVLRVGLEGVTPGCRRKEGEWACLHHRAGTVPPPSHFLHGYLGSNPDGQPCFSTELGWELGPLCLAMGSPLRALSLSPPSAHLQGKSIKFLRKAEDAQLR